MWTDKARAAAAAARGKGGGTKYRSIAAKNARSVRQDRKHLYNTDEVSHHVKDISRKKLADRIRKARSSLKGASGSVGQRNARARHIAATEHKTNNPRDSNRATHTYLRVTSYIPAAKKRKK